MWFKEPKYAWFIISILWIFGFLGSIGRVIVQYFQEPMTEDIGMSRGFLGLAWSTSILIGAACAPIGGWFTDRYGYRVTMIGGTILGALSAGAIVLFTNPVGYFIGFGILGGLAGISSTSSYVIVSEWFRHHRAKALMIVGSASSIGLAVITPFFVMNDSWLGWSVAYRISMAVGVLFIIAIVFLVKENKRTEEPSQETETSGNEEQADPPAEKLTVGDKLKTLLVYSRSPVLIVVIFALFTCGFSMGTVEMHLMAIQQTAHVSHSMFMWSLSILGVLELVGGFVFSALLDRLPRAMALSSLYFIRAIAFTILFTQLYWSPVLFTLIFGATYLGAIPGGILLASESLKTKSIGLQAGILLFFHQLGGVVAATAGGINFDLFHNYQLLIVVNIVLSLASCAGYYVVRERKQADNKLSTSVSG